MASETHEAIEAIYRVESPRLIARLVRMVRDVGTAEDLAQDALIAALQQWPEDGVPRNPGAWLMAAAKYRAIDMLRRNKLLERKHAELGYQLEHASMDVEAALDDSTGDDMLRLIFIACHPVLSSESRIALTLRLIGGLNTVEIARAFLVSEPTVAQRIVRAKRTLAENKIPFEVPRGEELAERMSSVLNVIYLIYNEGYAATAGEDWMRPALCLEALRLGGVLAELAAEEPEVHGLVALMEIQLSRARARVRATGEPILLFDQDRSLWDQERIRRGLEALELGERLTERRGTYLMQAAIAACHARAAKAADTDWVRIAELYAELTRIAPSPVVDLNRAVAVSMAFGPEAGIELVDAIREEPALRGYYLLPSVRGDFLAKLGRLKEAGEEFEKAAALTQNPRERELLLERARGCERVEEE